MEEEKIEIPKSTAVDSLAAILNLIAVNPSKESRYRPAADILTEVLRKHSESEWREKSR
jgi:hypothetical protein